MAEAEAVTQAQGVLRPHHLRRRPPREARERTPPPRLSPRPPAQAEPLRRRAWPECVLEDLTGIHRSGEVAALDRGANVAEASGDLTELRRGTDTAGQLAALRDAMRGAGADAQR